MCASFTRIQLESWLKNIDVIGSVLDIGGSQKSIKGRTKSWKVDNYKILDLEQPHECKRQPDLIGDVQEHYDYYNENENKFDVVFCTEVSEYWHNPYGALDNIQFLMKPKGKLYISFHTLYGLHNPKGEDSLRYTKNAIVKLLDNSEFEIIKMIPRTISEEGRVWLERFYRSEGMRLDYADPETWIEGWLVEARKR